MGAIDTSFVKQYASNVYHIAQQKDTRVWNLLGRKESLEGEEKYFDSVGTTVAMEKTGRNETVEFTEVSHDRRRLTMRDYYWATLVDKEDKLRLIINPESEYAIEARQAMARKMDDIAIASLLGTVYTGKVGATAVPLPDSQRLAATNAGSFSSFNLETLLNIKFKFDAAEVDDMDRHILIGSKEMQSMLQENKMTSHDYATIKALVNGEINSFLGFNFHRIERLPFLTSAITNADLATGGVGTGGSATLAAGSKRCIAFASSGMIAGVGANPTAKVSERADKHYANQLYFSMSLGAMRMEEAKVIEVISK